MSIGSKVRSIPGRARAFIRNRDANVAMIFALSIIPITVCAGAGVDMARAMIVKTSMTEALDAAALAVASTNGLSTTQMNQMAQDYFNANYKTDLSYGTPASVTVAVEGQSVTVRSHVPMPTILMTAVGIHTVDVNATSTVVWGQAKLWVSLVLDNTGSMTQTDATGTSKITALQTATHQLLTMLQNASTIVGDVQAVIVPFSKTVNVGTGQINATWIDWTDWASAPPGGAPSTAIGPGSACPWSNGVNGFRCTTSSVNGAGATGSVPASGLICPSVHNTNAANGQGGHYYNGCYSSDPTQTKTTTATASTPTTVTQTCTQIGAGAINCVQNSSHVGATTNTNTSVTTPGYAGNTGPTVTNTSTSTTNDGAHNCHTNHGVTTCTWTRTIVTTAVATTITGVGAGPWNHTWLANNHNTWDGCIMDRTQSYDVDTTAPTDSTTGFPAENTQDCVPSVLGTLGYDWTSMGAQVDAMVAGGTTNQTIGLDWGWLSMTQGDPQNAPALPDNTKRYIILVSDGLNTQDRFSGDGSNQDAGTDARMALACTNAKAAGIVIYTIFVDLAGAQGNSTVLQNCATDINKYFDLTTSGAIITTLNQIGQQITNVRVAS